MITIGVLALQGAFREHRNHLLNFFKLKNNGRNDDDLQRFFSDMPKDVQFEVTLIRKIQDLSNIDGIILPGGESTAMAAINFELLKEIRRLIDKGLPVFVRAGLRHH